MRRRSDSFPQLNPSSRSSFFFWARNAVYYALVAAQLSADDEVLVPAYVCKAVPEAILAYGAKVRYFPVDMEGNVVLSDLQNEVGPRTRAIVIIHYFGFPQPIHPLMEFCRSKKLFLIEDCAHVLQTELEGRLLGSFGDASVFSMRKLFPIFDGGALILNRPVLDLAVGWESESLLLTMRAAKDILDQLANNSASPFLRVYRSLTRLARKANNLFRNRGPDSASLTIEKTDVSFDNKMVNYPMSRLSKLIFLHSDLEEVIAQRRANYEFLHSTLGSIDGWRPLKADLPAGVCPWVFPLMVGAGQDACDAIRREGIPAVTWNGVRPDDLPAGRFSDADKLYMNLVFLPVHQSLKSQHLERIVNAVMRVRQNWN
jgi:dTDP-4-amino-4,6-dideoxygalactose transaminase